MILLLKEYCKPEVDIKFPLLYLINYQTAPTSNFYGAGAIISFT
jgi:hypothetical protein